MILDSSQFLLIEFFAIYAYNTGIKAPSVPMEGATMKATLTVPFGVSSKLLDELIAAIKEVDPRLSFVTERKATNDHFYFDIESPKSKRLVERVITRIESFVEEHQLGWERTLEHPKGCRYTVPLSETAPVYRRHREARERIDAMHAAGIDPIKNLLEQEEAMNPAVRMPGGYNNGGG